MWWFLAAFGVAGVTLMVLGWKKSPKRKPEPEMLWSREYRQMYRDCIDYWERLYQQK